MKRDSLPPDPGATAPLAPTQALVSPLSLRQRLPLSAAAGATVEGGRGAARAILDGRDRRLLVIVGPCSIHDPAAAMEYARRLRQLAGELASTLCIIMRVYFEKPRTSVGWKGMINDPGLDQSYRIGDGLAMARRLLLDINELGLPAAIEALDPLSPHYLHDLVSWSAVGARTTESQTHRELASALPMPVGFKNSTDGSISHAVNAILAARRRHAFIGLDGEGRAAVMHAHGNPYAHLVLRGGNGRPNYDAASVAAAQASLVKADIAPALVIDCSHGNASKNHLLQAAVLADVVAQRASGNQRIAGVMIESFLEEGQQALPADLAQLRYGCSITDACVSWAQTEAMLRAAHAVLGGQ